MSSRPWAERTETEVRDRILALVEKTSECWVWRSALTTKGYGCVWFEGRTQQAHRVLYRLFVGEIPEGLTLDHLCRNKSCVNPEHLEPVTNAENMRRARALVTHCKRGHPFDETNTYWHPGGGRVCRICSDAAKRRWAAKNPRRRKASA